MIHYMTHRLFDTLRTSFGLKLLTSHIRRRRRARYRALRYHPLSRPVPLETLPSWLPLSPSVPKDSSDLVRVAAAPSFMVGLFYLPLPSTIFANRFCCIWYVSLTNEEAKISQKWLLPLVRCAYSVFNPIILILSGSFAGVT